LHEGGEGEG
jgi:hypothetical protein